MSFVPEIFSIFASIIIFIFGTTFQYSFTMRFPTNSKYIFYLFGLVILNTIYLLGTDINITFSFLDNVFNRTNFSYIVEFIFLVLFGVYCIAIRRYNNVNGIKSFEFLFIAVNCLHMCILLINVSNFFTLFILLEMLSIGLYVMAAFNKRFLYSIEASIKYFILGSFSSSLILLGIVMLYAFTGFLGFEDLFMLFLYNSFFLEELYFLGVISAFVLIFIGFLFKLYSAPFHFWILDIYQGTPLSSLLLFSTIYIFTILYLFSKLYFFVAIDFFFIFYYIYAFFSFSCVIFGTLGALLQRRIKKLLAYSTITFIGYYLSAFVAFDFLTIEYAMHYFIIYLINLTGIFIFLLNFIRDNYYTLDKLSELGYIYKSNGILAMYITVFLFATCGMPPFWGFIGKLNLYSSLIQENNLLFMVLLILLTVISFFYYIVLIKIIYFNTDSKWYFYEPMSYLNLLLLTIIFFFNIFVFFFDNVLLSVTSFYSFSFLF